MVNKVERRRAVPSVAQQKGGTRPPSRSSRSQAIPYGTTTVFSLVLMLENRPESEPPSVVRSLIDHVARRARELELRVGQLEASTLIELTAFGTAVAMQYRENRRQGKRASRH